MARRLMSAPSAEVCRSYHQDTRAAFLQKHLRGPRYATLRSAEIVAPYPWSPSLSAAIQVRQPSRHTGTMPTHRNAATSFVLRPRRLKRPITPPPCWRGQPRHGPAVAAVPLWRGRGSDCSSNHQSARARRGMSRGDGDDVSRAGLGQVRPGRSGWARLNPVGQVAGQPDQPAST